MKAQTAVHFVDTNVIPDRNAGIASLLWDLRNPQNPDRYGKPLLDHVFAFIDVGASRAKVSIVLKTLLASDLKMDVHYVATEHPQAVPFAYVKPLGDRDKRIRGCLSQMISSPAVARQVTDWHFVVDDRGKVRSVSYSYILRGTEIWEAYYMGTPFLYAGETIRFNYPDLDCLMAPDVAKIETEIERDLDPDQPTHSWEEFRMDRNPLETGLADFEISLQKTDVPQRIAKRQNVLFLGNVLNNYPRDRQASELERMAANMEEGDIVIVQVDEVATAFIDVLRVKREGGEKTRERLRWINAKTLEVRQPIPGSGSWRQTHLWPEVERMASRFIHSLGMKESQDRNQEAQRKLINQSIRHVFRTFFRAMPVDETLRVAIREALRRLPSEAVPKEVLAFSNDGNNAYESPLDQPRIPWCPNAI